uniref:Uncharacterized protein n=1 Tax=viral metagenome TaxID=1070528 RepID=A0A6M3L217_9ZZZZ
MTEKIDWTKQIGRRVKTPHGRVGELLAYTRKWMVSGLDEFWHVSGDYCTQTEPTLLPEEPEWSPREGEWVVTSASPRPFKWDSNVFAKTQTLRPLTDDEKIDILGGIEHAIELLERIGYSVEYRGNDK